MPDEVIDVLVVLRDALSKKAALVSHAIDDIGDEAVQSAAELALLQKELNSVDSSASNAGAEVRRLTGEIEKNTRKTKQLRDEKGRLIKLIDEENNGTEKTVGFMKRLSKQYKTLGKDDSNFGRRNFLLRWVGGVRRGLLGIGRVIGNVISGTIALGKASVEAFSEAYKTSQGFFRGMMSGGFAVFNLVVSSMGPQVIITIISMAAAFAAILALAIPLSFVLVGLAAAITALAASLTYALIGALAALMAPLVALAGIIGVLGLAFIGMSDKAKKVLKTAIAPLKKELKELGVIARNQLFKNIDKPMKRLADVFGSKGMRGLVRGAAKDIRGIFNGITRDLKGPGFKSWLADMRGFLNGVKGGEGAITRFGNIMRQTFGGMGGLIQGMIPFMNQVLAWLDKVTLKFQNWANSPKGQRDIGKFFMDVAASLKVVWGLLKSVGSLLKTVFVPGRVAGDNIITSMTKNIERFTKYLQQNPDALANFFAKGIQVARVLGAAFVWLMQLLGSLAGMAGTFFKAIGYAAVAMSYLSPGLGFLRDIGWGLVRAGDDAKGMAADIRKVTEEMKNLGKEKPKPQINTKSFDDAIAKGIRVREEMDRIPRNVQIHLELVQAQKAGKSITDSIMKLLPFAGKKGGSTSKVQVAWDWAKKAGNSFSPWGSSTKKSQKAVEVAWKWAKGAVSGGSEPGQGAGGGKGGAAGKVRTVNWKWGKAPKWVDPTKGKKASIEWRWGKAPTWKNPTKGKKATINWRWGKAPKLPTIGKKGIKVNVSAPGATKATDQVKALKKAIGSLKAGKPKVTAPGASGATKQVNALKSAISGLKNKTVTITVKKVGAVAKGGPVMPDVSYTVNEKGREAFLDAKGKMTMINQPAWSKWSPPSVGGEVVPVSALKGGNTGNMSPWAIDALKNATSASTMSSRAFANAARNAGNVRVARDGGGDTIVSEHNEFTYNQNAPINAKDEIDVERAFKKAVREWERDKKERQ